MRLSKQRIHKVLGVGLGLGLALFVGEMVTRCFPFPVSNGVRLGRFMESERGKFCRYDPLLGWDGIPDVNQNFEWVDCLSHVHQNSYGYRGPAIPYSRTSKKRILALGDSFVWGFGVQESELFTAILPQKSAIPLEVVNLGVSGFGNDQEYLLWKEKGRLWHPDTVLLFISLDTDLFDNAASQRYESSKPMFQWKAKDGLKLIHRPSPLGSWSSAPQEIRPRRHRFLRELIRRSSLVQVIVGVGLRWGGLRSYLESNWIIPQPRSSFGEEYSIYQTPYDRHFIHAWELMEGIIRALQADVASHGARLTLVAVPSSVQVDRERWVQLVHEKPLQRGLHWDPEAPNRRLAHIASAIGIELIDLLPPLRQEALHRRLYFPYNLHWTPAGHEVVAEAIARRIP